MKINSVLGFSYHILMSPLKVIKLSLKYAGGNRTYSWRVFDSTTIDTYFTYSCTGEYVATQSGRTGILRRRVLSCHLSGKHTKLVFFHQESENRPQNIRIFEYDCNLRRMNEESEYINEY